MTMVVGRCHHRHKTPVVEDKRPSAATISSEEKGTLSFSTWTLMAVDGFNQCASFLAPDLKAHGWFEDPRLNPFDELSL
jgi:hypothetical protein